MRESPSIGHPRPCLAADNSSMVTFGWQSTQARDGHVPAVPGSVVSGRDDLKSGNIIDFLNNSLDLNMNWQVKKSEVQNHSLSASIGYQEGDRKSVV